MSTLIFLYFIRKHVRLQSINRIFIYITPFEEYCALYEFIYLLTYLLTYLLSYMGMLYVCLSVHLSRPSTDSRPGEIETPGHHHMIA